jgi:hypothetical protein
MRPRTITERNIAIQDPATNGGPIDRLALEYGLTRGTVYMNTNKRKPKKSMQPGDQDPFAKLG